MSQQRGQSLRASKKPLPLFLGVLMLTFGLLKVVNPTIDGWFTVQIQQSHLPYLAIPMGKIGEIMTGLLFLLPHQSPDRMKIISAVHTVQVGFREPYPNQHGQQCGSKMALN